jgi:hypothetical protein
MATESQQQELPSQQQQQQKHGHTIHVINSDKTERLAITHTYASIYPKIEGCPITDKTLQTLIADSEKMYWHALKYLINQYKQVQPNTIYVSIETLQIKKHIYAKMFGLNYDLPTPWSKDMEKQQAGFITPFLINQILHYFTWLTKHLQQTNKPPNTVEEQLQYWINEKEKIQAILDKKWYNQPEIFQ